MLRRETCTCMDIRPSNEPRNNGRIRVGSGGSRLSAINQDMDQIIDVNKVFLLRTDLKVDEQIIYKK